MMQKWNDYESEQLFFPILNIILWIFLGSQRLRGAFSYTTKYPFVVSRVMNYLLIIQLITQKGGLLTLHLWLSSNILLYRYHPFSLHTEIDLHNFHSLLVICIISWGWLRLHQLYLCILLNTLLFPEALSPAFIHGAAELWSHPLAYGATAEQQLQLQQQALLHPALQQQLPVRSFL